MIKKCTEWIHNDQIDNYILKYYVSSRPGEGVKIFNIDDMYEGLNKLQVNNLENELEYSFVLVPVKNGVPYKSSNMNQTYTK